MRFVKMTAKYILKNLLYVLPFMVVAGGVFTVMFDYSAFGHFIELFFTGRIGDVTFNTLMRAFSVINLSSWYYALISVVSLLVLVLAVAMEFAFVEKHMRIGRKTINGLFERINDNIISTASMVLFLLVMYQVWCVLTCAILYASLKIFEGAVAAQYVFSILIILGMLFVLFYLITMVYLWLPCAQITGFTTYESLKYSFQLVSNVKMRLVATFASFFGVAMVFALGFTAISYSWLHFGMFAYLIVFCVYAIMFGFFTVGQEVVYFDTDQLERADLLPSYRRRH